MDGTENALDETENALDETENALDEETRKISGVVALRCRRTGGPLEAAGPGLVFR
jgi:hypothetical protein